MRASSDRKPTPLGERILQALGEENRTQTSAERQAGFSQGHLSKIIYGERGGTSLAPEKLGVLAEILHVNFEWLLINRGPMRRDGRTTKTPAEEAIHFARLSGAREDAIQDTWERLKGQAEGMTALDWALAIDATARMLERAGVPRPEDVHHKQKAIAREATRLKRRKKKRDEEPAEPDVVELPKRRATSA